MQWYIRRLASHLPPPFMQTVWSGDGQTVTAPVGFVAPQQGTAVVLADGSDASAEDIARLFAIVTDRRQLWGMVPVEQPLTVQCIVLCARGLPPGLAHTLPRLERQADGLAVTLHIVDGQVKTVHSGRGDSPLTAAQLWHAWTADEAGGEPGGESGGEPGAQPVAGSVTVQYQRPTPVLTYGLLALVALLYAAGAFLPGPAPGLPLPTFLGAQHNLIVLSFGEWWRPVTAMFLHADLLHLGMNCLALYQLGPVIERAFGRGRYLLIWLASGLAGNWLFLWLGPLDVWTVGASGAIFGLFGALVVLGLRLRQTVRPGFWAQIAITLGINLYVGLTIPTINMWAHAGGFVAGLVWAAALLLTRPGPLRRLATGAALVATALLAAAGYLRA